MELDTTRPFRGSDAVKAGLLTWGRLRGPAFRRLESNVYVACDVPDTPLLHVEAVLARFGPEAVATGWSACVVQGLDVAPRTMPVEVATPALHLEPGPGTAARRLRLAEDEVTVADGRRSTTPLRTVFDLAARSGPDRHAIDRVIDPLTDAVVAADALARFGGFVADDLTAFAARHRGARGVRRVARVAALLDPRPDSPPETRVRVQVVLAGLPRPVVRFEVRDARGMLCQELDLAWPRYRVAIEYDGRDHTLADRRGRDIDRLDSLRRDGWIVVVVTAYQLGRPRWVADRAREALLSRGWVAGPNTWAPVLEENAALMHALVP